MSSVTVLDQLTTDQVRAVEAVLAAAETEDGTPPVNEAGRLALHHPRPTVRHLLVADADAVLGYSQLDTGPEHAVAQLVVRPDRRRHGLGRALLDAVSQAASRPLQVWAMGDHAAARALAARSGLVRQRELLVMERLLDATLDQVSDPPPPAGVVLRAFRPGADDAAWLAVNTAAFAHHPEQGRITADDLEQRMATDWFDPAGFLVAQSGGTAEADSGGELVGFHWTKQHPDRLGEVYVLGVAPSMGGRGLGKSLLGAGLRHLRSAGNTRVELYVEAEHTGAVSLYRGYGFAVVSRDVMYGQA